MIFLAGRTVDEPRAVRAQQREAGRIVRNGGGGINRGDAQACALMRKRNESRRKA
jgi:hypothetical protein